MSSLFSPLSYSLMIATALAGVTAQAEENRLPVIDPDTKNHTFQSYDLTPDAAVELRYGGTAGVKYRDNIYRENTNDEEDVITVFSPGFVIDSNLPQHAFKVKGKVESGFYASNSDNDYTDADLQGEGRYDVAKEEFASFNIRTRYDHVEVGGFTDDENAVASRLEEPTFYRHLEAGAGYQLPVGQHAITRIGLQSAHYNYDNVNRIDGTRAIQDDRDRSEAVINALAGIKMEGGWMPFIQLEGNRRYYQEQIDSTALFERDSDGLGAFVGTEYNSLGSNQIEAMARIGYLHQDYNADFLPDMDEWGMDAALSYRFSDDSGLYATAHRRILENTLFGASGTTQTQLRSTLYHDVTESIRLDGTVRYTTNDFEINPASGRDKRVDDIYQAALGANYHVTDPLYVRAEYGYEQRESDEVRAEYDSSHIMLSVGLDY